MDSELFEKILLDHRELASLPQTLSEVMKVARSETASARDLADVLMHDPPLTARILRVVNSPFYSGTREVSTVTQAVLTMGTRAVTALALSASVHDLTNKWGDTVDRRKFWRHSLETAIASRLIAERVNYESSEEAFVAGLLHDIGVLVLEKSFPDKFERVWKRVCAGESLQELEEAAWGTNHARVGQFLLDQWNLPTAVAMAVGHHHDHFAPGLSSKELFMAQIIALANNMSQFKVHRSSAHLLTGLEQKSVLQANLGLQDEDLLQIEENLTDLTIKEAEFLDLDIGSTDELLIEANRILFLQYNELEKLAAERQAMHEEMVKVKLRKTTLETIHSVTASFTGYLRSATRGINSQVSIMKEHIKTGRVSDPENLSKKSLEELLDAAGVIESVLAELKQVDKAISGLEDDEADITEIELRTNACLAKLAGRVNSF